MVAFTHCLVATTTAAAALLVYPVVDVPKGHVKVLGGHAATVLVVAVVHRHWTADVQALIALLIRRRRRLAFTRPGQAVCIRVVATTCSSTGHLQILHGNAISLQALLVVDLGLEVDRVVHVVLVPVRILLQQHWVLKSRVHVGIAHRSTNTTGCHSYVVHRVGSIGI